MLKNLRMWLDGHPHFNVEAVWGPLVKEWVRLNSLHHSHLLCCVFVRVWCVCVCVFVRMFIDIVFVCAYVCVCVFH